jgi:hypothetical protein
MHRVFIGTLDGLAKHDWLGRLDFGCGRWL